MARIICNRGACFSRICFVPPPRSPISFFQNMHLYQSLPHAQRELPKHVLKKYVVGTRSGFMGRISGRILGFFGFSGFLVDSGLMSSGLVLGTRPVFLKAAMIVQELHPGSIFVFFLSNLWAVFCCVFIVFCFLFDFAVFGSFSKPCVGSYPCACCKL